MRKVIADLTIDNSILKEAALGNFLSPAKKRRAVEKVQEQISCPYVECAVSSSNSDQRSRKNTESARSSGFSRSVSQIWRVSMDVTDIAG